MRQPEPVQPGPDARAGDLQPVITPQLGDQRVERQVALLGKPSPDPGLEGAELAPASIALTLGRKRPGLALQLNHIVHELHRHTVLRCRRAVRMTLFDMRDDPRAQLNRMWFAHIVTPYLPQRQGITQISRWES